MIKLSKIDVSICDISDEVQQLKILKSLKIFYT